jgi:4-carboxymuconolactone decarboxylase
MSDTNESTRYQRGRKIMENAYGVEATDQTVAFLDEISKDYSQYLVEACFGDVYGRPALDQRAREMINIVAIIALGGLEEQLARHVAAALDQGASVEQITETIFHLTLIVGHPKANAGFGVAKQVFDAR